MQKKEKAGRATSSHSLQGDQMTTTRYYPLQREPKLTHRKLTNLQIPCHPHQNTNIILHRIGGNLKIHLEALKTLDSQSNPE